MASKPRRTAQPHELQGLPQGPHSGVADENDDTKPTTDCTTHRDPAPPAGEHHQMGEGRLRRRLRRPSTVSSQGLSAGPSVPCSPPGEGAPRRGPALRPRRRKAGAPRRVLDGNHFDALSRRQGRSAPWSPPGAGATARARAPTTATTLMRCRDVAPSRTVGGKMSLGTRCVGVTH